MDHVRAMRVLVAVLDRRSLSAAAATLGMSLPTVSRILSSLERELGVKLIARTTRGIAETDGGLLYYRRCQKILADLEDANSAVQAHAQAPVGELRVTAPVTFGRHHVAPAVAEFLEKYPRLSFYLSLTDRCESLSEQRLDVAIRVAIVRVQAVTVRRLGYIQRAVVGSRDYFKTHPIPATPHDLAAHNCMHFTYYLRADEWNFDDGGQPASIRVRGRMRTDNQEALMDAVLAGAGLAVLPTWLIKPHLDSGQLRRVLTQFEAPRTPVYAVFPRRGAPPNKVRAFVDFLAERYRRDAVLAPDKELVESSTLPLDDVAVS
ncbi:MAG TPA: LysR family transcriptional regulator [Steroidobacteraceae bacterium]|nr:LysR family transcriptional regulator [Steroidobacteraceae bacterium]